MVIMVMVATLVVLNVSLVHIAAVVIIITLPFVLKVIIVQLVVVYQCHVVTIELQQWEAIHQMIAFVVTASRVSLVQMSHVTHVKLAQHVAAAYQQHVHPIIIVHQVTVNHYHVVIIVYQTHQVHHLMHVHVTLV
jgi:hypothetical protein